MIRFFRKNAATVGWAIVIAFSLTMFSGALFFGFGGQGEQNPSQMQEKSDFANLGNIPIDPNQYYIMLNSLYNQFQDSGLKINPMIAETLKFRALNSVVDQTLFLKRANDEKFKLTGQEKNQAMLSFLVENNLKNKKELKELLKEKNYPYKQFKKEVEDNFLMQTYTRQIYEDLVITDEVLDASFIEYKIQALFLDEDQFGTKEQTLVKANDLIASINNGLSFTDAIQTYTQDAYKQNDGVLENIRLGQLSESIESEMANLEVNQISAPIVSPQGIVVIKLLDKVLLERPADFDKETVVNELENRLKSRRYNEIKTVFLKENPLNVQAPDVKAVVFKSKGDLLGAIGAYQKLSSLQPSSPYPNFYMAEVYLALENYEKALEELEKSDIKSELSADLDFPELHYMYGEVLAENQETEAALIQFNKTYELIQDDQPFLEQLKESFKKVNALNRVKDVETQIAFLVDEKERMKAEAASAAALETERSVSEQESVMVDESSASFNESNRDTTSN